MRRSPALVLAAALVASTLFAFTGASALTPVVGIAHPGGDDGNLSTIPTTYNVGDLVELYANFATDQAGQDVEYFKETPADSGNYEFVGHDDANSNGNAYLKNYQVNATQRVFAKAKASGKVTEIQTLTPGVQVVTPDGPIKGTLSETPSTYSNGDTIQLGANFPDGSFQVSFYKEGPIGTWTSIATVPSNSSGNAYFKNFVVDGSAKVFARKSNNDRTEVDTIAPAPKLSIDILRDCTGNDCAATATATGVLNPAQEGRVVKLQYKSGTSWVQVGSDAATDAAGKVAIQFSLVGLSQWTTRTYRLTSAADQSSAAATSLEIKFMPGPTKLGPNVLHVDVAKGVYPTSTSAEYTAEATLRQNGTEVVKDAALEKFGVRGSSTASYTKKPYKLKLMSSPAAGVFGMTKDKSWTLLANYLDQSSMRDKVALELGRRLGPILNNGAVGIAWTPDSRYVEMFVNDQYVGAYLMTESVKIDGDRVDINEESGMIMETDGNSVSDSSLGFKSTLGQIAFAFKDPDEVGPDAKDVNSTKLKSIKDRVNLVESKLYTSSRNQYPNYLDVASTIDYYLVKEFTKDNDADFYRSHYFWWDPVDGDGKLHFGPAWDFDRSAGNVDADTAGHTYVRSPFGWYMRGTGTRSDSGRVNYTTHWFVQLFKTTSTASFNAAVKARWPAVKAEFEKTWTEDTAAAKAAIGIGASNDRKRWASEPKRYKAHVGPNGETGFDGEVAYLTKWYKDRFTWMDDHIFD